MTELYDSIFRRKSTRKYKQAPLSVDQLDDILAFARAAKPLEATAQAHIELAGAAQVGGLMVAKAPHYLLAYAENSSRGRMNIGFVLQQVDLYLSSLGLGSCWLGMAKTKLPGKEGLVYVIALAFGQAEENPQRALSDFSRKALDEISKGHDERLEAVRLAPSATNSQPWYFVCQNDHIDVYREKLGKLKAMMLDKMNEIDMGIALCHLWLAGKHENRPFSFTRAPVAGAPALDGYLYLGRVDES